MVRYRLAMALLPLERIRATCMALPDVTERPSHGEPAWFAANGRAFASLAERDLDGRVAVWCSAAPGAQEQLVESDPGRFFRPPYVGVRGWVGIWLDGSKTDWERTTRLVREAHAIEVARRHPGAGA